MFSNFASNLYTSEYSLILFVLAISRYKDKYRNHKIELKKENGVKLTRIVMLRVVKKKSKKETNRIRLWVENSHKRNYIQKSQKKKASSQKHARDESDDKMDGSFHNELQKFETWQATSCSSKNEAIW